MVLGEFSEETIDTILSDISLKNQIDEYLK